MDGTTARIIPVGSVIERRYWSAPRGYVNPGAEFETEIDALAYAVANLKAEVQAHDTRRSGKSVPWNVPLPERITIDLRWVVKYPQGGSIDTPVTRTIYANIADAEAALERQIKFARV